MLVTFCEIIILGTETPNKNCRLPIIVSERTILGMSHMDGHKLVKHMCQKWETISEVVQALSFKKNEFLIDMCPCVNKDHVSLVH